MTEATFVIPIRVTGDPAGNIYIADQGAHLVRKVAANGIISMVAGNGLQGYSRDNGLASAANLNNPTALAMGSKGNLYICDQFNQRIRKVDSPATSRPLQATATPASGATVVRRPAPP